ncbi:DUF4870 domain-containing protein [Pseudonocardia sp.]|uniref:DUF4870 domain-containing protein n=1 Tax=Pseudonocardia sp. TaxID=60912 RepID=UPI003D0E82C4
MSYPQPSSWSGTTSQERNWALAAHVGSFLAAYVALGLLAPLIVLLVKGNESPFIRRHAVESLNFQITTLLVVVVGVLLTFVLIGFVVLAVWAVFYVVVVILATIAASQGRDYRYPLTLRLVS